jgi:hypothetical protein
LIEFLNKGAHYSSLTGEKLSEHQAISAVEAAQKYVGLRLKSYLLVPTWDDPPYYSLLIENDDLPAIELADRLALAVEQGLRAQNVEYVAKRDTRRLGPVRIVRIPVGSWAEFQRRRLVKCGGTVEQYKQPHLVPDMDLAASFFLPHTSPEGHAEAVAGARGISGSAIQVTRDVGETVRLGG